MNALELSGVSKSFGDHVVLEQVDLVVSEGTIMALLGASGSGKTTLLRIMAGFEVVDAGTVTIGGVVVDDGTTAQAPERRRVGYVPQDGSLFPNLSVEKNVLFGLPRARRRRGAADGLLEQVGLAGLGGRRPDELSGGQRQRVALARALALDPRLILLDEPFGALDESMRAEVRDEVIGVLRALDATAILVTHDQDEALSVADRVAVLQHRSVVQEGPPEMLYEHPADPELAKFLGEANVLEGNRTGVRASTALGEVLLDDDCAGCSGPVRVVLRPEQLGIVEAGEGTPGTVVRHQYFGHDAMTHVATSGDLLLAVRHEPRRRLQPGDAVGITVLSPARAFEKDPKTPSE